MRLESCISMTACGLALADMATYDNTYSRVVAWLKILLPLLALAILSTLFLVARAIDPAQNIPYADVDINELALEQRIGKPNFSGLTHDGAAVTLSATKALPDPNNRDRVVGNEVAAGIDLPDGTRIDIVANKVGINASAQVVDLTGDVSLTASNGYTLVTETLTVSFVETRISARGGVEVLTPLGNLTSGEFLITGNPDTTTDYILVFKDRVRLVYTPGN